MKFDLISIFTRSMVFMESKKIDFNRQGMKVKMTEQGHKRKKYDQLRKVLKLKVNNLIQANKGLGNILMLSVFFRFQWFTKVSLSFKRRKKTHFHWVS